jgi:hypothetical protein
MKIILAVILLSLVSSCAFGQDKAAISESEAACGPQNVQFKVKADESQHPTPAPENGKAMIYVVQRAAGVMKFGADGKWIGALKGGTYFSASLDPGEHHFCTMGHLPLWKGLSLNKLSVKPGETYYFFVHIVSGGGYNELTLSAVNPDEGKELVARAKLSEFISK